MKYWIFSILTAAIAYLFGTLNSLVVASRLVFKTNLRRVGKGSRWLPNFRRIYGVKGFAKLAAVEFVKDAFPLLIAGLLFHADGNAVVGRALAAFCLVLGRMYPSPYGFRGSYGTGAIVVGAMFINFSVGFAVLAATILFSWLTKYLPLGTLAGAIVLVIAGVLVVDNDLAVRLCIFIAVLTVIRVIPAISRISSKQEPKLSLEEDITYKFDEQF
ncbi:MAG: glycerol-3-phosphate acyltransferase [Oscillospiraceae bacterium]|nr:glycerol-3-phosphate acyltransferase [Oscillospiraceae bacterium]